MKATTQKGMWTSTEPISRRVRVDHLDLHRNILKGNWYTDTLIYKVKLILGNNVANLYTQGKFSKVYPITAQRKAGQSLIEFTDDFGVHEMLLTYEADEFTGWNTDFLNMLCRCACSYRIRNNVVTIRTTPQSAR